MRALKITNLLSRSILNTNVRYSHLLNITIFRMKAIIFQSTAVLKKNTRYFSSAPQYNLTEHSLRILKNNYPTMIQGITYPFIFIGYKDSTIFQMPQIIAFFDLTDVNFNSTLDAEKLNIYELLFKFFTQKGCFENLKDNDYFKIVQKFHDFAYFYISIKGVHMILSKITPLEPWFELSSIFHNLLKSQAINIKSLVSRQTTEELYKRTIDLIFIRMKNIEHLAFDSLNNIINVLHTLHKGRDSNNINKDPLSVLNLYLVGKNTNNLSVFLKNIISLCYDSKDKKTLIFTPLQENQVKSYLDKVVAILQLLQSFQVLAKTTGSDSLQDYNAVYINNALMKIFKNKFYFKELMPGSMITNTQYKRLLYLLNCISFGLRAEFFFHLMPDYNKILIKVMEKHCK